MPTNALLKTNTSGTWNSTTGFSYSTIPTITGIAHKDQIEVERKFTVPSGTVLVQEDFRKIYVIPSNNYTVDETNKKITGFSSSFSNYITKAGVTITIPAITNGDSITVRRKSISSESLVTWIDGTRLTASQLNLQTSQLVNLTQELLDRLNYEFVTASDLEYNFGYTWATRSWVEGRLGALPSGQSAKTYIDAADANLQTQVDSAVAMNTTQNGRLDAIESLNTSQTSSINTLNTRVSPSTSLTGTYSASNLSAAVNGLDTRVTATESTNTTQTNNITALQNKVDVSTALSNSYASLTAGVNNLHTRVSATESTNTSQGSAITALETKVGAGTVTGTIVANGSDIITAVNAIDDYVTNAITTSTNTIFNGHAQGRIVYAGASGTKDSTANFTITPSGTSPTVLTLTGNLSQTGNQNITGNLTQVGVLNLTGNTTSVLNLTGTFTVNADSATVPTFKGASSQKIVAFKNSSNVEVNAIDQYGNLTGRATAVYGAGSPTNPLAGTIWYDSANTAFKIYNGSAWTQISTTTLANYVGLSGNETVGGNKTFSGLTTFSTTATASTGTNLPFKAERTNNGNIAEFWGLDGTNNPRLLISTDSAVGITLQETYGNAAHNLIFKIGNNERLRINQQGVGVGTIKPKAKLDITTEYGSAIQTKKIYKTWAQVNNSLGHTSYSHVYLKLFRVPENINDGWNVSNFTITGTLMANRANDLGVTTSAYIYASKAYSLNQASMDACVHYGYISFEPINTPDSFNLVKVNDGGVDWVCVYYVSSGANINAWTFDGIVSMYDSEGTSSDNKHFLDLTDPTLIKGPDAGTPTTLPATGLHTSLAYTPRRVELGDFAGTAMSIGTGEDASSVADTPLIVTNDGDTNLAVRDSTNNVELMNKVTSTGATIGTVTNHSLVINTNNTAAITVGTNQQVHFGTSNSYTQTDSEITLRNTGKNSLEWGHANQAGYVNTLGYKNGSGSGFIGFNAEGGTNNNTFRTRGLLGSLIQGNNDGGVVLSTLANSNSDNQTSTDNFIFDKNGRLGIGTVTPVSKLSIGNRVNDDNGYSYDTNTLVITHPTATSTTVLNDPKEILLLTRQSTVGQAYGAAASFRLSRYETGGDVGSRTRLDLVLAHYQYLTSPTTVMTLLSSGNVGIGLTNPQVKLHIATSGTGSDGIYIANSTNSAYGTLHIQGSTGGVGSWANGFVLEGVPASTGNTILSSYTNNLVFQTNNRNERMRIDTTGNVGIGTSSPLSKLHIKDGGLCYERTNNSSRQYTNLGSWFHGDSITGIVEIAIPSNGWTEPVGGGNINTMLDITIDGRNYTPSSSWTVKISGYFYAAGTQWHSSSAQIIGRCPFNTVRLGFNTTTNKPVILLGETTTVFSYPDIRVSSVSTSYSNQASTIFSTEWAISGGITSTTNYTLTYGGSNPVVAYSLDTSGIPTFRTNVIFNGNVGIGTSSPASKLDVNGNINISSGNKLITPTVQTDIIQSTGTLEFRGDYTAANGTTADMTINSSGVVVFNQPPLYNAIPITYPETTVTAQASTATSGFRFGASNYIHHISGAYNIQYRKTGNIVQIQGLMQCNPTVTTAQGTVLLRGCPIPNGVGWVGLFGFWSSGAFVPLYLDNQGNLMTFSALGFAVNPAYLVLNCVYTV